LHCVLVRSMQWRTNFFVMLDMTLSSLLAAATNGYLTSKRLKRLSSGAHKLAPTGNQARPSWLLRLRSGLSQARLRLGSGSAQAKLRFAHLQLRLKQQQLRSKDGNGNCLCRDSDVEFLSPSFCTFSASAQGCAP